jgi:hypothetical protein
VLISGKSMVNLHTPAPSRLALRLGLVVFDGEPLHVRLVVGAAALDWRNVINLETWTGAARQARSWAGVGALEFADGGAVAGLCEWRSTATNQQRYCYECAISSCQGLLNQLSPL